jgi:hypothetical protein
LSGARPIWPIVTDLAVAAIASERFGIALARVSKTAASWGLDPDASALRHLDDALGRQIPVLA